MKKTLFILLCFPMIFFGQVNRKLNHSEIDERIKKTKYTIVKSKIGTLEYDTNFDYFLNELSHLGFNIIENSEGINECDILYITVFVTKDPNWFNCGSLAIGFQDCDDNVVYFKNNIGVPSAGCYRQGVSRNDCCLGQYGQTLIHAIENKFKLLVSDVRAHQQIEKKDGDNYESLLQLAELLRIKALSEEEFDKEKRKILGLNDNTKTKSHKTVDKFSLVDKNIPSNKKVKNRYALVIGNEDYKSKQRGLSDEQNVDYAVNDAIIFREYALGALGVKEDNMFFLTNATAVEMGQEIKRITKMMEKLAEKGELIIYYAGHGHPHENTKTPYLIPVDVSADNLSYAIKLEDLYRDLSVTNAKRITIFIDACFTGGGRSSGLIASRGVRIKPKGGTLNGNIVVFSASSGEQSALPYHKEGHGMFTYYLLKKLQKSKGSVKMGELADYLKDAVSLQSLKENKKEQDPVVNISKDVVENWKDWEF